MLTEHQDESVTLSHERKMACIESAWELDALGTLLGKLDDSDLLALQVRTMAIRIVTLAGVLMMATSDKAAKTEDLMKTVCPWKP